MTTGQRDIDYESLVQNAMRGIVRTILARVAKSGLPGEHHFYIAFRTDHPEAHVPPGLRRQFPEEMTIILQHQFWNLEVGEASFGVTLRFGGQPQRLEIPFDALVSFADPFAQVGFRFTPEEAPEEPEPEPPAPELPAGGNVVAFGARRKK